MKYFELKMYKKFITNKTINNLYQCYTKSSKTDKFITLGLFNLWLYSITHADKKMMSSGPIPPY